MNPSNEQLHELLDRTHIASDHVQMALGEHPAIQSNEEWKRLCDAAIEALETLYQKIGESI